MKRFKIKFWLILILCLGGCGGLGKDAKKYRETKMLMGTIVQIDCCSQEQQSKDIERVYKEVWKRLEEISWRMYVFDEKSDVSKINYSDGIPVEVEADTYQLLKDSVYFSKLTHGAFDITVWPLIKLWKDSAKKNQIPSKEDLRQVQKVIGAGVFELLDNNQVRLRNKDAKVDLGGIAKGYAVDEAARIFRAHGMHDFFIDAGGDIYVGGQNCKGELWRIGIRDPRDKSKILNVIQLTNAAVTTSGNYEQYLEIQGRRWSHIIDPVSGYPQKEVVSATVIAPSAKDADALSTALSVLGSEKGTALINHLDAQHASLIMVKESDNEINQFPSKEWQKFQWKK